jgi:hypothetical protein
LAPACQFARAERAAEDMLEGWECAAVAATNSIKFIKKSFFDFLVFFFLFVFVEAEALRP